MTDFHYWENIQFPLNTLVLRKHAQKTQTFILKLMAKPIKMWAHLYELINTYCYYFDYYYRVCKDLTSLQSLQNSQNTDVDHRCEETVEKAPWSALQNPPPSPLFSPLLSFPLLCYPLLSSPPTLSTILSRLTKLWLVPVLLLLLLPNASLLDTPWTAGCQRGPRRGPCSGR